MAEREPVLVSFLFASVLRHRKLEDALGVILANKLQTPELPAILLRDLIHKALDEDLSIRASIRADLLAARTRDPAAHGYANRSCIAGLTHSKHTESHTGYGDKCGLYHTPSESDPALCVDVIRRGWLRGAVDHGTSVVIGGLP
jgi:hypothetical protein